MQTTLLTADEFVEPLTPALRSIFRPTVAHYRGIVGRDVVRVCACGKAYLYVQGRPLVRCAVCHAQRVWREEPAARRRRKLARKFGITPEEYQRMHDAQHGVCAICLRAERFRRVLAVDHCHKTGRVRGLLCGMCNTAIGKLDDSPELLARAIAYLEGARDASVRDRQVGGI